MNNIDPKLWGPPAWDFLFYVTLSYPDNPTLNDKNNMKSFFQNLGQILPCEKCRYNYNNHIINIELTDKYLSSRYNLVTWLINIHNEVCKLNGKHGITFQQVMNKYTRKHNMLSQKALINIIIFVIIFMLILLAKMKQ